MSIGVDIVQISRIKDPLMLAKGILSTEEFKLFEGAIKKEQFIAGRFAAKEAFMKANKKGIKDIPFKEIEVLYDNYGAPYIFYKNEVYDVSISHDGDYAIAISRT